MNRKSEERAHNKENSLRHVLSQPEALICKRAENAYKTGFGSPFSRLSSADRPATQAQRRKRSIRMAACFPASKSEDSAAGPVGEGRATEHR